MAEVLYITKPGLLAFLSHIQQLSSLHYLPPISSRKDAYLWTILRFRTAYMAHWPMFILYRTAHSSQDCDPELKATLGFYAWMIAKFCVGHA